MALDASESRLSEVLSRDKSIMTESSVMERVRRVKFAGNKAKLYWLFSHVKCRHDRTNSYRVTEQLTDALTDSRDKTTNVAARLCGSDRLVKFVNSHHVIECMMWFLQMIRLISLLPALPSSSFHPPSALTRSTFTKGCAINPIVSPRSGISRERVRGADWRFFSNFCRNSMKDLKRIFRKKFN